MKKILAIDTTQSIGSVAIQVQDQVMERVIMQRELQSELILPMIDELLSCANLTIKQLDAIAFSAGPGSFTGVRLAASVAQGLCFGSDIPAIQVSTLRAVAQSAYREHGAKHVLVAIDAHAEEIYWANYSLDDNGLMRPIVADMACSPGTAVINLDNAKAMPVGDGWRAFGETLTKLCTIKGIKISEPKPDQVSHAIDILKIANHEYTNGNLISAKDCLPIYLAAPKYVRMQKPD